ncbi:hypothetical protein E5K00_04260 [Hymenobacter aquaticus]|uniref:Uncharacterized protein n=1 Tax=Hymenobacter aquaticus TaxID=1867101 RepID=A0A4Z0Q3Y8_9BACT|nr:hypothetical protein [Hymenobacter aquaticus]TGE24435.1 hypothetical protein E5K00_04260 [Hymenobacter aquaticus]
MNYSLNQLGSAAECDEVLAAAQKERAILTNRRQNREFESGNLATTAPQVQAELTTITAQLTGLATMLPTLPEGPAKDKWLTEKERLEYQQKVLNRRVGSNGILALLGRELDLARLNAELAEVDAFIAAVQARKAAL